MTQPNRAMPRVPKKSASPADRSAEFAETQRRLKQEAAERRQAAGGKKAQPTGSRKSR
jgi:hypothetical protein